MPDIKIKKDGTDYPLQTMPLHYPADRVYLDGDTTKTVQDALDDMFVQTTVTPNISIPAKGYNFYSYDKPVGYKLISVNMEQNSLAIFSQITKFGNTDRISFFNAYTEAVTLEHSITLTFVKI